MLRFFGQFTLGDIVIQGLVLLLAVPENLLHGNIQVSNHTVFADDIDVHLFGHWFAAQQFFMPLDPGSMIFWSVMFRRGACFYFIHVFIAEYIHE